MNELFRHETQLNGQFLGDYGLDDTCNPIDSTDFSALEGVDFGPEIDQNGLQIDEKESISEEILDPQAEIDTTELVEVPRSVRLSVRCTVEADAWVKGLAAHVGLDVSSTIWQALLAMSERSGFYQGIPRRYVAKARPGYRPVFRVI